MPYSTAPDQRPPFPFQITLLNLQSIEPITVMIDGEETRWNVNVQLSQAQQNQQGTMTIRQTDEDGGTFDSLFPVIPAFTFFDVNEQARATSARHRRIPRTRR